MLHQTLASTKFSLAIVSHTITTVVIILLKSHLDAGNLTFNFTKQTDLTVTEPAVLLKRRQRLHFTTKETATNGVEEHEKAKRVEMNTKSGQKTKAIKLRSASLRFYIRGSNVGSTGAQSTIK